jgi:hypothetical protein
MSHVMRNIAMRSAQVSHENMSPPEDDESPSILDCPNETGTFLADYCADMIHERAIDMLADYLTGSRDGYAEAKLHRLIVDLAERCESAIETSEAA